MNVLLYGLSTSGKIKTWKAFSDFILNDSNHIEINLEFGYLDGKLQTKKRIVKSGKNIGKKNETTIQQQAELEIKYLYTKQFDSRYVEDILKLNSASDTKRSMLAHKYKDKFKRILCKDSDNFKEKQFAQRKLNGIRCFYNFSDNSFTSRVGKPFRFFEHLNKELLGLNLGSNVILDGELFSPNIPFEAIQSLVNSQTSDEVTLEGSSVLTYFLKDLQFHVYDYINLDTIALDSFETRLSLLDTLKESSCIKIVETVQVKSETEMYDYFNKWLDAGFEGLMLRSSKGLYKFNHRSNDLLKVKEMEQAEFKVVDIYLAENDTSKIMFTCVCNHSTFNCVIKGNKKYNYDTYYLQKSLYLNKYLTINYQTMTSYNIPSFPVGISFRDGDVVDGIFIPSV